MSSLAALPVSLRLTHTTVWRSYLSDNVVIYAVPAFADNYLWIGYTAGGVCFSIDPGNGEVIEEFLDRMGWTLDLILLTHHHDDHIGGVAHLRARYHPRVFGTSEDPFLPPLTDARPTGQARTAPNAPSVFEPIPCPAPSHPAHTLLADSGLASARCFALDTLTVKMVALPGHTPYHVGYLVQETIDSQSPASRLFFVGDVLFGMGCGYVPLDTPPGLPNEEQPAMLGCHGASLRRINHLLSDNDLIFCAHEYTKANGEFALRFLGAVQHGLAEQDDSATGQPPHNAPQQGDPTKAEQDKQRWTHLLRAQPGLAGYVGRQGKTLAPHLSRWRRLIEDRLATLRHANAPASVPFSMGDERRTNIFLASSLGELRDDGHLPDPATLQQDWFSFARTAKNRGLSP
ncbi:MAG: MBL fold metallo-hydrolase [Alphaproteobacteria bacterium]|nr:MBL fold metallo-hydrolase [Alphaproteobacteria bacterium]